MIAPQWIEFIKEHCTLWALRDINVQDLCCSIVSKSMPFLVTDLCTCLCMDYVLSYNSRSFKYFMDCFYWLCLVRLIIFVLPINLFCHIAASWNLLVVNSNFKLLLPKNWEVCSESLSAQYLTELKLARPNPWRNWPRPHFLSRSILLQDFARKEGHLFNW